MLSIFSCDCWPSVCLLWRKVYLGHLAIFLIGLFIFAAVVELYEFFVHFGDKTLMVESFAKIFSHSVGCLFFSFLFFFYGFLSCAEGFDFN